MDQVPQKSTSRPLMVLCVLTAIRFCLPKWQTHEVVRRVRQADLGFGSGKHSVVTLILIERVATRFPEGTRLA